jgi:alpha-amylase
MKKLSSALLALSLLPLAMPMVHASTFVHLFEWQWNDIASECENHLGPKGYAAIQVSPPQKSITGSEWWTRYQPVSYAIEGRSGSRAEFASMVSRCKAAGVDIYVDAVINHMAAWNRSFPEVPYSANDFNNCRTPIDYQNQWSIQNCDLSGLNDLKTDSNYVRGKIADYMNDLLSLGVAGFRIDAAKHMPHEDIANIVGRLNGNPYIFQEVIGAPGEPVQPSHYSYISDITEFNFSNTLGHYFKGRAPLKDLRNIGSWSDWLPSHDAVTFVANHDNQRQNTPNIVTHKDGHDVNNIAHVFMLAWPYGYAQVMSSYDWNTHDQGPPSHGASSCSNGWLCEHRNREIANMVGFRNTTQSAFYISNWWDNGASQIAFGRGDRGFVVINGENGGTLSQTLQTGLPANTYCDVINADYQNGICYGPTINVAADGTASFSVGAKKASAIHVDAVVGDVDPDACRFEQMHLRGTFNNWSSQAMTCNDGVWNGTASFSGSATDRFKFDAFGDWATNWGDTNNDGTAEQSGSDIFVSAAGNYVITFNDHTLAYSLLPVTNSSSSSSSSSSSQAGGDVAVNFSCRNGSTYMGQSVYVTGNHAALGNWSPASAIRLSPNAYPEWSGSITLPANTAIEWKCVKRDENNPSQGVVWQGGANNSLNTANTSTVSASF